MGEAGGWANGSGKPMSRSGWVPHTRLHAHTPAPHLGRCVHSGHVADMPRRARRASPPSRLYRRHVPFPRGTLSWKSSSIQGFLGRCSQFSSPPRSSSADPARNVSLSFISGAREAASALSLARQPRGHRSQGPALEPGSLPLAGRARGRGGALVPRAPPDPPHLPHLQTLRPARPGPASGWPPFAVPAPSTVPGAQGVG